MDLARRTLDVMAVLALLVLGAFVLVSSVALLTNKAEFSEYAASVGPLAGAALALFRRERTE